MPPTGFWEVDSVAISVFQIDDESYASITIIGVHLLRIIMWLHPSRVPVDEVVQKFSDQTLQGSDRADDSPLPFPLKTAIHQKAFHYARLMDMVQLQTHFW